MVPTNRTEGRIQGSKEGQGPLRYRMKVLQEEFIKKCYCKTVSLITKIIGIVSSIKLRCDEWCRCTNIEVILEKTSGRLPFG